MIAQDSFACSGIEVYKTKDTNIDEETNNETQEKEGFVLHNGAITEVAYLDEMFSNSFEYDYEDISSGGSVSLPEVDDTRFYKGTKILLKKAWNPKSWEDLKDCLLGFITEQSYNEEGVQLKIAGMSKLLEQEKQFNFTKTKRSKILRQIIESSGLKAKIDTKGLKDDVIDYTNVSTSSSTSSGSGDADLDKWVQETIGNETDDLKKAEKIHNGLCNALTYTGYTCSRYSTVSECWKSKKLNCADSSKVANAACKSAGLNSQIVHGPNHFWTIVTINGKEFAIDPTSKSRSFNSVWKNLSYYKKCGDTPDC